MKFEIHGLFCPFSVSFSRACIYIYWTREKARERQKQANENAKRFCSFFFFFSQSWFSHSARVRLEKRRRCMCIRNWFREFLHADRTAVENRTFDARARKALATNLKVSRFAVVCQRFVCALSGMQYWWAMVDWQLVFCGVIFYSRFGKCCEMYNFHGFFFFFSWRSGWVEKVLYRQAGVCQMKIRFYNGVTRMNKILW